MLIRTPSLDIYQFLTVDLTPAIDVKYSRIEYYWQTVGKLPRLVLLNPIYKDLTPVLHRCTTQYDARIPPDSIYEASEGRDKDCWFICRIAVEDVPLSMFL